MTTTDTNLVYNYLETISSNLKDLAEELANVSFEESNTDNLDYEPRGTILKALQNQSRFKPKSMWVSLGNGKYQHLTGEKGLIAKHSRLEGYTYPVFRP
jgi:hypothetical protein